MNPSDDLIDELYRERVINARKQSWADKFLACGDCFELALDFLEAGIRHDQPDADDSLVAEIRNKRLALADRLEHMQ